MKSIATNPHRSTNFTLAASAMTLLAVSGTSVLADEQPNPGAADALPATTFSSHGGFGVGVIAGEPTGLSLKAWLNDTSAIDAGFAWSFTDPTSFHIHADYLWHNFSLLPVPEGELPLYFGIGGRVRFKDKNDDTRAGVRLPVGIAYHFPNVPVELFAEVAPVVDFAPKTDLDINGGVGVRYYFR